MKVMEPDFATVTPLVRRQGPPLLVFGFATLLLISAVCLLSAGDGLPSGALDTRWWPTLAALVAIRHRVAPRARSKRSSLPFSRR